MISVLLVIASLVIVMRLYFVQIVNGETFRDDAQRQYINKNTISYDRGSIFFETKDSELIPAAISRSGYTLAVNPSILKDPDQVFSDLSRIVPLEKEFFLQKTSDKSKVYAELATRLNTETAESIRDLNIYGVSLSVDKWRFYPGQEQAAQTIGFVAYKGDDLAGRYGLERYYEETLKKDAKKGYNSFFAEFFTNVKETFGSEVASGDIVTTIEPSVQQFVESEIDKIKKEWKSDGVGAIVMNPKNGEIIAISSHPTFDPNSFSEYSVDKFQNILVENVFEMGSIIKPLTMAAGIDSGTVTASSTYYDAGFLVLNSKRISNYDGKGRGTVSMQEVLNQSLNTGVAHVAMKMGNKKFSEYMKNFGVGTETGIDLPNETRGLINNLDSNRDIEIVTASYGQGIALTPIATVRALSVLANGGTLVTPHLVKKIEYDSGLSKRLTFEPGKRVISEDTSIEISRMLTKVVDTALRGGDAKIPGYSVAAKTGTAQMTDEGRAGYVEGKYLHSFFGYFPAQDAKFMVFLFHTYPKGARYASETLTDSFLNITKFLISYYQIPPDKPENIVDKLEE